MRSPESLVEVVYILSPLEAEGLPVGTEAGGEVVVMLGVVVKPGEVAGKLVGIMDPLEQPAKTNKTKSKAGSKYFQDVFVELPSLTTFRPLRTGR